MEIVDIRQVRPNPDNPRIIKGDKFKKLVKSIKEFPEMLELRPIVVNSDMVVLGGNMRLKACEEAGLEEVPILYADKLTEDQQKEFVIKDNSSFGEWDWDILANEWDTDKLTDWGLDLPVAFDEDEENNYSRKIEPPTYEPSEIKPDYAHLVDKSKMQSLLNEIELSNINESDKEFLRLAAYRHLVFNYGRIADFYANSDKEVQELMERSALVIIDFDKAIEGGYIELSKTLNDLFKTDYNEE
jgi:hypothetical protein